MLLDERLRALRSDDTPQRIAQQALIAARDAWLAEPGLAGLQRELAAFDRGQPLGGFPLLASLFEPGADAARQLAAGFTSAMGAALGEHPLGHIALRHFTDGTNSTLLLARTGGSLLSLVAMSGQGLAQAQEPVSVSFAPCAQWEHVLAGTARAEKIECRPSGPRDMAITRSAVDLKPGSVMVRDCSHQALHLRRVDGCLVSLRLLRRHPHPQPTREYELASGRFIHQAAGDPRESRHELMCALLGRMGRSDAAPLMAAMARETGSTALRWQALRECLGLDTRRGFEALCHIARSADDPLSAPAGALRSQLIEAHPQLRALA